MAFFSIFVNLLTCFPIINYNLTPMAWAWANFRLRPRVTTTVTNNAHDHSHVCKSSV